MGYDDQLQNSQTASVDFGTLKNILYSPYLASIGEYFFAQQYVYKPLFKSYLDPYVEQKHRYASGYINASYTYNNRYNAFFSLRKDYADVCGLNAKYRGTPLWSVGAAWNMDQETFMKSIRWINFLKLRFSYGVTGNIYQGATSYLTASSTDLNTLTNAPLSTISSPANPNLKWETTKTTNVGVDFSLLDNRLRGSFDYYLKKGSNIFSVVSLNPSTGFSSMVANMADMRNDGLELQLTYDWLRPSKEGLGWSSTFTGSYNKNKVTKVNNPATQAYQIFATTSEGGYPFMEGYPSSALFAYNFAGIEMVDGISGETAYYLKDGTTTTMPQNMTIDNVVYCGQSEPKYVMGLDNSFEYKGFSLGFMMAYYGGHKMRALEISEQDQFKDSGSRGPLREWFLNAWTPENTSSTIPNPGRYAAATVGNETTYSTTAIHYADFLKIRNIVFGYQIPESLLRHVGISRASLRFQIDNPKYLWVRNGMHIDPETLGVRNPTSYVFGLNINI